MNNQIIMHYDLDAFYASVEQALKPAWSDKPLVVATRGERSVISAASYQARKYGIKSAMTLREGLYRCPELVVAPVRFPAYRHVSSKIQNIIKEYSPIFEPLSLDEAYVQLDVDFKEAELIAGVIRQRVFEAYHLYVSIGLADTKTLAKIASDDAKPNGVKIVEPPEAVKYLQPLAVQRLSGVGAATRSRLNSIGILTIKDLQEAGVDLVVKMLGKNGLELYNSSFNNDRRKVTVPGVAKSISHETTFDTDVFSPAEIRQTIGENLSKSVSKLQREKLSARTISVKVRSTSFVDHSKSSTTLGATSNYDELLKTAEALLKQLEVRNGVRLVGVSLSGLQTSTQPSLFEEGKEPEKIAETQTEVTFSQGAYYGREIEHSIFGKGIILSQDDEVTEVKFSDRARLISNDFVL